MKVAITYERLKPSTSVGEGLRVIYTYTSMDKSEIDAMETIYDETIKARLEVEVKADADKT